MAREPKIRINELARELEVKAGVVLDLLPELGVTQSKTHSSSVGVSIADKIRDKLAEKGSEPETKYEQPTVESSSSAAITEQRVEKPEEAAPKPPPQRIGAVVPRIPTSPSRPSIPVGGGSAMPLRPPVVSLRPPLRTKGAEAPQPVAKPASGVGPKPPASVAPAAPPPIRARPEQPAAPGEPVKSKEAASPARPGLPVSPPVAKTEAPGPPAAPAVVTPEPKDVPAPPLASAKPDAPSAPPLAERRAPAPPRQAPVRTASPGAPVPSIPRPAPPPGAPRPNVPSMAARNRTPNPGRPAPRAPVRPPIAGAPGRPAPGAPAPAQRRAFAGGGPSPRPAARHRQPQQAAAKPSLVPGQPIYQRPKSAAAPVPGMPMTRPGLGMPLGARPGQPGQRPGDGRRPMGRPTARRVRDLEAERERKILQQRSATKAMQKAVAVNKEITAGDGTTVKELAEKLGIKASVIIKTLVERGLFATINQTLDMDTLKDLSKEYGATVTEVTFEEESLLEVADTESTENLLPRPPVVTVMGHVDHGKTSLLDALRQTNVAEREAGGITQAIGASQVEHKGQRIVFIDTPGHEAFTRMRAHGAKVTDVVILVVAADDGVMPQTIEAIDHAKSANVPIVVAINKIDKDNADPDRVKQQLAERGLLPEDWGGDTIMAPVSAVTKEGLDHLLEVVLLVSEMRELRANPNRSAIGTVLEAKLDRGQGPVATVLIENGTLRVGDYFLVGSIFGKVRAMIDHIGGQVAEAGPSTAVIVLGLDDVPIPGDQLHVVSDLDRARKIAGHREEKMRDQALAKSSRVSLEQFREQLATGEVKELPVVLKCDVQGSLDVLKESLGKLITDQVKVDVIHSGVGAISESDVLLAIAANAVVIGFNIRPERSAAVLADREKIDIRLHTVIYELIDELKKALTGMLDPIEKETFLGRAEVLQTFHASKVGTVAGCILQDGRATATASARLLRDNKVVHTGKLGSLRRFKDDVKEVRAGQECGMAFERYNDIKVGDVIELFLTEKVAQELKL